MSYIKKHPILRKLIVLSILALAGIGIGEIYQYFSAQTVEETLVHYQAKPLLTSTMRINGVDVIGKVWQLPAIVSPSVLKESKGRALVVPQADKSHLVYSFDKTTLPDPTDQFYPQSLPRINGFECQYTIDMTNTRTVIMGRSTLSAKELEGRISATLTQAGWTSRPETLSWQKGNECVQTLVKALDHGCSCILLLETR